MYWLLFNVVSCYIALKLCQFSSKQYLLSNTRLWTVLIKLNHKSSLNALYNVLFSFFNNVQSHQSDTYQIFLTIRPLMVHFSLNWSQTFTFQQCKSFKVNELLVRGRAQKLFMQMVFVNAYKTAYKLSLIFHKIFDLNLPNHKL